MHTRTLACIPTSRYPRQEALAHWDPSSGEGPQRTFTLAPDVFYQLFPFHLLLDEELRVVQCGAVLARLLPELAQPGATLQEHFSVSPRPGGRGECERPA